VALTLGVLAAGPAPLPRPVPATFSLGLCWTAPGDDGWTGRAAAYDLRYSTAPITEANFTSATPVPGVPPPKRGGSDECITVDGLASEPAYYFAIKARDEAGNWSPLSNVAAFPTQTMHVDDPPLTLELSAPWPNPARAAARCAFALPRGTMVRVDVFGVGGRHVRRLASGFRPAGRGELVWDLLDDAGHPAPAGLYLMRARLGERVLTRRLIVTR
jgi:hypothetical protein